MLPWQNFPMLTDIPMNDEQARVASPCTGNCCLDTQDICLGCFRTLQEITAWGGADAAERKNIVQAAAQRRWRVEVRYSKDD